MTKLLRAVQWQVDHFAEIPVLVVPCLGGGARAGLVPYMPSPHVLASGGLGAGLVTLPLWSVTSARKILGLPPSVTPYCLLRRPTRLAAGPLRADDAQAGRAGHTPRRVRQPRLARQLIGPGQ
jgi:hypothetical protein